MRMVKLLAGLLSFIIVMPSYSAPAGFLKKKCHDVGGKMVSQFTCPQSGTTRYNSECIISDVDGNMIFFDGCSGTIGNYDVVFYKACVHHDLCYHHEPSTSGLDKRDCDSQFYWEMRAICKKERANNPACIDAARLFYNAVDLFGLSSWTCSKQVANYRNSDVWSEFLTALNL